MQTVQKALNDSDDVNVFFLIISLLQNINICWNLSSCLFDNIISGPNQPII